MTEPKLDLVGRARWIWLSAVQLAGRRVLLLPALVLAWPVLQFLFRALGWQQQDFEARAAQSYLIGAPLALLAVFLGARLVAGVVERRTLELAYVLPGGAHRLWLGRLVAAALLLIEAEVFLALATVILFTNFPPTVLATALVAPLFYLALASAFGAYLRSEVTAAIAAVAVLALNGLFSGILGRLSPFWNPLAEEAPREQLLIWGAQNRAGFLLATIALVLLTFHRAEDRERMLR